MGQAEDFAVTLEMTYHLTPDLELFPSVKGDL